MANDRRNSRTSEAREEEESASDDRILEGEIARGGVASAMGLGNSSIRSHTIMYTSAVATNARRLSEGARIRPRNRTDIIIDEAVSMNAERRNYNSYPSDRTDRNRVVVLWKIATEIEAAAEACLAYGKARRMVASLGETYLAILARRKSC